MMSMSSYSRRALLKVILLGNSGVGKTALLERFITNRFSMMYKATIGADFMTKEVEIQNHKLVTLQLWDTAGQERFQSLGTHFYRGADCCILVYDVTALESFEDLENWRNEFIMHAQIDPRTADSYPFILIGNKVDRENEREVLYKMAEQWCQKHGNIPYFEASAKDSTNVVQGFTHAAELAFSQRTPSQNVVVEAPKIDVSKMEKNEPSGGGCCN
eukprot:TRINITY_DN3785_c0_g1_i2.p1 TRINITY_DN3785_c0_g1~~TRINITY_DN3785_c0_g1_i2.p1  ORF type:complete len:216 (-),score=28.37 TRINITY_DN3785_c0_g1_i2:12-659(-)